MPTQKLPPSVRYAVVISKTIAPTICRRNKVCDHIKRSINGSDAEYEGPDLIRKLSHYFDAIGMPGIFAVVFYICCNVAAFFFSNIRAWRHWTQVIKT